jgi:hypothetical protein
MKKKLVFIFIAVLGLLNVNAQEIKFGAKAGINFATITGDDTQGVKGRTSLHVGAVSEFVISDKFSIQPELLYSAQGAKYEDEVFKETIKLDYLNLPIMAKFYVADGFSLEAGPQVGFLLSAKGKVEAGGESIEADIKELFKGIDFGFNFGVGYKLPSGINFGARYNLGLSNIIEPDSEFNVGDVKNQNGVIQLSLGYFF